MRNRKELTCLFRGEGVELGVAAGKYSSEILQNPRCIKLWSIDRWSDHHNEKEYHKTAEALARKGQGRCIPLRMSFESALSHFPDESLDFVYVDGYAHTGQENGQTLQQWWSKVKPGGVFAGHDYDPKWPRTVAAVDRFCESLGLSRQLTRDEGEFRSWWVMKPQAPVERFVPERIHYDSPVLPGQSVLLVGNGPSILLRGERGAQIDSFDQVVRFNTYAISGFEAFAGTKTTLWATFGRGRRPKDATERPSRAIYVHGENPKDFGIPISDAFCVARDFFETLRARVISESTKVSRKPLLPSSGLVVALWLLQVHNVPHVSLVGFDHFSKRESGGHHYWLQQSFTKPPEHDGDAEAQMFSELKASGRIRYLD